MRQMMKALTLTLAALLGLHTTAQAQTASIEYYHQDAVGSVRAVTNHAGQVVRTHDYFPFGDGPDPSPALGQDPRRFIGKERDRETGLDYFGARYYAQRSGRFRSVDPKLTLNAAVGDPQRFNRYAYALNNPITMIDPDGREVPVVMGGRRYNMGTEVLPVGTPAQADQAFGTLLGIASIAIPDPSDIAIAAAVSRPVVKRLIQPIGNAVGRAVNKVYHYTTDASAQKILRDGLLPGQTSGKVYTTPNGTLSPVQAQIELALPPNRGLPNATLEIDMKGLRQAGITPSLGPVRVQPTRNAPGGGTEIIFNQAIPPQFIRPVGKPKAP
jgi:RHS repeat-associated protein